MTNDELEERQERLAAAILKLGECVAEVANHAGYSPGKRLSAELIAILDGKSDEASAGASGPMGRVVSQKIEIVINGADDPRRVAKAVAAELENLTGAPPPPRAAIEKDDTGGEGDEDEDA